MTPLFIAALLSNAYAAAPTPTYPAQYHSASCVDDQVYEYGRKKKEVKLKVKSTQDSTSWKQGNETFEVVYAKENYNKTFQNRISVILYRYIAEGGEEGKPLKQAGTYGTVAAHSGGSVNERADHTFESEWAYEGDLARSTRRTEDGKEAHAVEKLTTVTSPTERTIVKTIANYIGGESGGYTRKSSIQTCKQVDQTREAVMKGKFRGPFRKAIQKFEGTLAGVSTAEAALADCHASGQDCSTQEQSLRKSQTARDELWGKLIRPKDLLGYIVPPPQPSPPDNGGGGGWDGGGGGDNSNSCSGTIWCGAFEHCINGKCVPKDAFNRCDAFNSCSFGESCVDGVCTR